MLGNQYHFPTFILRYKIPTHEFLQHYKCPVIIFHRNEDRIVSYNSSIKLKEEFSDKVQLITLEGQSHNGITENEDYKKGLKKILIE